MEMFEFDKGFTTSATVIIIICLCFNILGFVLFYFNNSRKVCDALLAKLIMISFIFQGFVNYSTLTLIQYETFFNRNPIHLILLEIKIYSFINEDFFIYFKLISKAVNVGIWSVFFPCGIFLEFLYCFESIHLFKNPVSSTSRRLQIYTITTLVLILALAINYVVPLVQLGKDNIESIMSVSIVYDYMMGKLIRTPTALLACLFFITSITSIPLIILGIRKQSVLNYNEKRVFRNRHIIYTVITVVCMVFPFVLAVKQLAMLAKETTVDNVLVSWKSNLNVWAIELMLLIGNVYGVFSGVIRLLELKQFTKEVLATKKIESEVMNLESGIKLLPGSKDVKDDDTSSIGSNDKSSIGSGSSNTTRMNTNPNSNLAPLSSKIMFIFLSESVFIIIKCFLEIAKFQNESTDNIQKTNENSMNDDDDNNYLHISNNNNNNTSNTLLQSNSQETNTSDYKCANVFTFDINPNITKEKDKIQVKPPQYIEISSLNKRCNPFSFANNEISLIEYAPKTFRNLRKLDNITQQTIELSFNIEDNIKPLNNFQGSEGKSGSVFFITHDSKFIIKTISKQELNAMLNFLLENYYKLNAERSVTYLTRIYGLFTLQTGSSELHVVLMENIAPFNKQSLLYKFDLKGSIQGRRTKQLFSKKGKTFKDLDYIDIKDKEPNAKIILETKVVRAMKKVIKEDLKILREANLMDYSLFIAVAKKESIDKKKLLVEKRYFESKRKGFVYLIGIIDYLTFYGWKKKAEDSFKGFCKKEKLHSAVHPKKYAERFIAFMFDNVLVDGSKRVAN